MKTMAAQRGAHAGCTSHWMGWARGTHLHSPLGGLVGVCTMLGWPRSTLCMASRAPRMVEEGVADARPLPAT